MGCPYTSAATEELKATAKKRELNVSEQPFKPASLTKKTGGNFGSNFGLVNYSGKPKSEPFPMGARIEYMPQGGRERKKKGDIEFEPPNIMTRAMPKGGFGVPLTTLGVPASGGERRTWLANSVYFYAADPYDSARIAAKEDKKKRPGNVSEEPFRPASLGSKGGPGRWGASKVQGFLHITHIHAYIRPYIHANIHTYVHTFKGGRHPQVWRPMQRVPSIC